MADIFPFKANWATSPEVLLAFRTDIFRSRSGKEQRRALRTTARRTVSYTAMCCHADFVKFTRLMGAKQNVLWTFPDWLRSVGTYGCLAGEDYLTLRDSAPAWLTEGATVVLCDGDTLTQITIEAIDAYTLTVAAPLPATSPFAVLRPVYTGLLAAMKQRTETSTVGTIAVEYQVTPGSVPLSDNLFFANVVDGKEVFAFPWNWGEEVSAQYEWPVENVDYGRGVITTSRPVDFGTVTQSVTMIRQGDQIDGLMRFFERQKGQRGQFWMPTGTEDMKLVSTAASGATTFTVEGTEIANLFGVDEVYKGIAVYMRDGRRIYRKINSIISASGNSVITVSAALTFAVAPDDVAKICWMRVSRLASDEVTLEYLSDDVVQYQARTVSLTYGTDDELDYDALDGAAQWAMDNWDEETALVADAFDYAVNIALPYGDIEAYGVLFNYGVNAALPFGDFAGVS